MNHRPLLAIEPRWLNVVNDESYWIPIPEKLGSSDCPCGNGVHGFAHLTPDVNDGEGFLADLTRAARFSSSLSISQAKRFSWDRSKKESQSRSSGESHFEGFFVSFVHAFVKLFPSLFPSLSSCHPCWRGGWRILCAR